MVNKHKNTYVNIYWNNVTVCGLKLSVQLNYVRSTVEGEIDALVRIT